MAKVIQDPCTGLGHSQCMMLVTPSRGNKKKRDFNDFLEKMEDVKISVKDVITIS